MKLLKRFVGAMVKKREVSRRKKVLKDALLFAKLMVEKSGQKEAWETTVADLEQRLHDMRVVI